MRVEIDDNHILEAQESLEKDLEEIRDTLTSGGLELTASLQPQLHKLVANADRFSETLEPYRRLYKQLEGVLEMGEHLLDRKKTIVNNLQRDMSISKKADSYRGFTKIT